MLLMAKKSNNSDYELEISLSSIIVVQSEEYFDDYSDNYVRRHWGPIRLISGEPEQIEEIGEIELWYIDGSRAIDNGLNIVDVCDSIGQEEHDYADAIYSENRIDEAIIQEPMSNDVLVFHSISILPEYRGKQYGLRVTRKIIETIGYHCGAVLLRPTPLQFSLRNNDTEWTERMNMQAFTTDEQTATEKLIQYWNAFELRPTKNPPILCVVQ